MLSIIVHDTLDGYIADVYDDGNRLTPEQVAMNGIIRWYVDGSLIADGRSYECADECSVGDVVECRLEG